MMQEYQTENIRNVAVLGHGSCGKTSLVEALSYFTGATTRIGSVDQGTSVSDFDDEEHRRKMSISLSLVSLEEAGYKINLLDTPGFLDFNGEVQAALQVADGVILVVDAVGGVEVGTELLWQECRARDLPVLVVINKLDRDNADFQRTLQAVQALDPNRKLVPVTLPWGEKQNLKGVLGLLSQKARPGDGRDEVPLPPELLQIFDKAHTAMEEAAAEGDDDLLVKYLDGEHLNAAEIELGFRQAVQRGSFVPVMVTAATANIGVGPILAAVRRYFPNPGQRPKKVGDQVVVAKDSEPTRLYAFKTTADVHVGKITYLKVLSGSVHDGQRFLNHNRGVEERLGSLATLQGKKQLPVHHFHAGDLLVVSKLNATVTGDTLGDKDHPLQLPAIVVPKRLYALAIHPVHQIDSVKMGPTLQRLVEEDPSLAWYTDPNTHEVILAGMGDQHLEIAIRHAAHKFGTHLKGSLPKIAYRESITKTATGQYRHKKQTGGSGQFGEVQIRIEPLSEANIGDSAAETDLRLVNEVFGGAVSASYFPAIEKGIRSVMQEGVVAGYPVQKVFVAVTDGKEHAVDSKPIAFEAAGREAFKLAVQAAQPALLEPIMQIRVTVPESAMGDVMGDLNTRRARVLGLETIGDKSTVVAEVPQVEVQSYVTDLRALTHGRGVFSLNYLRHEPMPANLQQQMVAAHNSHKE